MLPVSHCFKYLVIAFYIIHSSLTMAQSDVVFTATGTLYINVHEQGNIDAFTSDKLFAAVNPKLKKLEMKIPINSIYASDSLELPMFFSAFDIDSLSENFLRIFIDFPTNQIALTDFVNKQHSFTGSVNFGEFEWKGAATVNGIYNVEYLLFDFDIILNGPFERLISMNNKEVTEVHLFAKGVKVFGKR